jgi:two-component system sensor histidine kinase CpxA
MMKLFSSLFAKILFWFLLNLILVAGVLLGFYAFQSKMDLDVIFGRQTMDRMHVTGRLISHDLTQTPRATWNDVLTRYSEIHRVNFALLLEDGSAFLSKDMHIPDDVMKMLMDTFPPKPPPGGFWPPPRYDTPQEDHKGLPPNCDAGVGGQVFKETMPIKPHEKHGGRPRLMMRTKSPTQYWARIIIPVFIDPWGPPQPAMLIAASESINGFFFDPLPWMIVVGAVLFISVFLWIPLVRNITRPLARMTTAAEQIARGRFDVRIREPRADEIGRLADSINHMTLRLSGFIKGQKRFLGDVAHELASPVARIHVGLSILEKRVEPEKKVLVADVMEDVEQISSLINELLSFSRAEITPYKIKLVTTDLLPVVNRVIQREETPAVLIITAIEPGTTVIADPELLARALANIVRNAIRYAGDFGPIHITAENKREAVVIEVRDAGPGVPQELVEQLFEPFFRPEPSRSRDTGGVGLGLAIVKTCIEACDGTVSARNLEPVGFAVTITLGA